MARKPRPSPFTLRMSDERRAELDSRAARAGLSAGGYLLSAAFNAPPPRHSRRPTVDQQLIAPIIPALGKVGGLLNQLAHQAHQGSWPDSRLIEQARADIRMMRNLLFSALGRTPPDDPPAPPGP